MSPFENNSAESDCRFEQAADWYLRTRGDLSAEEILEWEQWYADPKNQEAFEWMRSVSPLHGRLHRPELLKAEKVQEDDYDGSVSVAEWSDRASASKAVGSPPRRATSFRKYLYAAAAGLGVATLLGATLLSGRRFPGDRDPVQVFQTQAREHRTVTLSDGSTITLGARTRISTQYSVARRNIRLEEGEALFSVAKNTLRPFTVAAAGGTVTAVGTQFNVRSDLNRVTVTVTEGAVDVAPAESTSPVDNIDVSRPSVVRTAWAPARVAKGQEVTYEENQGRGNVAAAGPGATEWMSGRLQYRQVSLKYVAADVQRYLDRNIVFADDVASGYEFTGTIDQSAVGDWLFVLERIFPVEVTQADGRIVIRSRENPSSGTSSLQ